MPGRVRSASRLIPPARLECEFTGAGSLARLVGGKKDFVKSQTRTRRLGWGSFTLCSCYIYTQAFKSSTRAGGERGERHRRASIFSMRSRGERGKFLSKSNVLVPPFRPCRGDTMIWWHWYKNNAETSSKCTSPHSGAERIRFARSARGLISASVFQRNRETSVPFAIPFPFGLLFSRRRAIVFLARRFSAAC